MKAIRFKHATRLEPIYIGNSRIVAHGHDGARVVECRFARNGIRERDAVCGNSYVARFYAHGPRCVTAWRDSAEDAIDDYNAARWCADLPKEARR